MNIKHLRDLELIKSILLTEGIILYDQVETYRKTLVEYKREKYIITIIDGKVVSIYSVR